MPGVKANTQDKSKKKEAVGGGGAAGKAERTGAGAPKLKCKICMQELLSLNAKSLQEHVDSKHSKSTVALCFPDFKA